MKVEEELATMSIEGKESTQVTPQKKGEKDFQISETFDSKEYEKIRLEDLDESFVDKKITTFGWVTKCSALKKYSFLDLFSSFKTIKCVIPGTHDISF